MNRWEAEKAGPEKGRPFYSFRDGRAGTHPANSR